MIIGNDILIDALNQGTITQEEFDIAVETTTPLIEREIKRLVSIRPYMKQMEVSRNDFLENASNYLFELEKSPRGVSPRLSP